MIANANKKLESNAQIALYICGFLFIFTETLLSPFYPQFFAKAFGISDSYITGEFMAMCRLVVVFSAPIWGFLANKVNPVHLLIGGQIMAAILTAAIAWVESIQGFYIITFFLLCFKSSYLLFYTLLININKQQNEDPLAKTVGWVQVIMHTAIISSTLVSSWVVKADNPLELFIYAALIDVVQVIFCLYILSQRSITTDKESDKKQESQATISRYSIIMLALVIFSFHWAVNIIRPFFTSFSQTVLHVNELYSAIAYLLPSLMVLLVIPFLRHLCTEDRIKPVLILSLIFLMLSSFLQANAESYSELLVARAILGIALIFATACIDIFIFSGSNKTNIHLNYSISIAIQNLALFIAPITAAYLVKHSTLSSPFLCATGIYIGCLAFVSVSFKHLKSPLTNSQESTA